jgi:putative RecB family exonuclease
MVNVPNTQDRPKAPLGPRYLSPTALQTFSECPKRYRYAYIERPEVAELPSPNLLFGNCLHTALAWLYRLAPEKRSVEVAHHLLRVAWSRADDRDLAFTAEGEEISWGERALEALDWYCTNYDLSVRPEALEEWVQAHLPNEERIGGLVDRLDARPDSVGGLEVIDYKSGKCRLEDEDLARDWGAQLYAVAATRAFKRPVTRVRFIYLAERLERRWEIELEDFEATVERLVAATTNVRAETEFPALPSWHCRWCRYRRLCPERDRLELEDLDPNPATPF